ncbi:MAG TPA: hypothetical protein VFF74_12245 [Methylophilaceae bacterium]|nr:hypothetical protein [Methylophilaceae bacterium]
MIRLRTNQLMRTFCCLALFFVFAHVLTLVARYHFGFGKLGGLIPLFDLDHERNLPTCFSTFLAVFCSALLALIAKCREQASQPWLLWAMLALAFFFIGLDDIAELHEHLSTPLRRILHTGGLFYYAWIIPYGAAALILAVSYYRFVFEMPPRIRNLMITSAIVFMSGALGLEMLGAWYFEMARIENTLSYGIITMIEESMEMLGLIIFLYSLLIYIETVQKNIYINLGTHAELTPYIPLKNLRRNSSALKQR